MASSEKSQRRVLPSDIKLCLFGDPDSTHLWRWAHHFASRGFAVSVISNRVPRLAYEPRIAMYALGMAQGPAGREPGRRPSWSPPAGLVRLLLPLKLRLKGYNRVLAQINPDIVHGHYGSNWGYVAQQTGRHPLVTTLWGSDVLRDPNSSPLTRYAVRKTLAASDLVTFDSQDVADAALRFGADPKRLLKVVLGVGDPFLRASVEAIPNADRGPVVISHRSLAHALYNIGTIVEAMPLVIKSVPHARLIVGNDGPLRAALESRAAALGLSSSVSFVGDAAGPGALARRLMNAAVYVSVPATDGTSVTLLEAMAAQAYPVLSDIPANREWISETTGAFVPHGDPIALSEAIIEALKNPDMRARAVAANLTRVRDDGLWARNMEIMEAAYRGLVASSRESNRA